MIGAARAEPQRATLGTAELIAEQASLPADGGAVTLGLALEPDEGWHLYWRNPGDAGLAPTVDWDLPEGFEISDFQFPAPHLIPFGPLNTYGFEEPVLLLATMTAPAGLSAGDEITITGKADWVVCDHSVCTPDKATVSLTLGVADGAPGASASAARFETARAKLPQQPDWPARMYMDDGAVVFEIDTPEEVEIAPGAYLFPAVDEVVRYDSQSLSYRPGGVAVTMNAHPKADRQQAVPVLLKYEDASGDEHAVLLTAQKTAGAPAGASETSFMKAAPVEVGGPSLLSALVFAFLGGLVLNLMPCVFPVLSAKALSVVQLSSMDRKSAQESGLLYTAGVLLAFLAIGGFLVALRSGGEAVGWGFQMQSPVFNAALGLLMLAIGLNLFGVIEVGTSVMGLGQGLTEGGERKAAFFTGLLAVLVATPCTAPFMAGALGYALAQPAFVAISVFALLGLGLAFPYLLLCFVPSIGCALPRPGAWMNTFKQVLAFPMLATSIWLFWVVGRQAGVNGMAIALGAALALGFALWAWGKSVSAKRIWGWRAAAAAGLVVSIGAAMQIGGAVAPKQGGQIASAESLGGLEVEPFTPERVANYVAAGEPVFLYFSADWCVTCKVNERVALASAAVGKAFADKDIKVIKADWTTQDPLITDWLARYDRAGVPLYVYVPSGETLTTATILPQALTPSIVVSAIAAADARAPGKNVEKPPTKTAPEAAPATDNWSVMQSFNARDEAWRKQQAEMTFADVSDEERTRLLAEELGPRPDGAAKAVTAALSVLEEGESDAKTAEAAAFILKNARHPDAPVSEGALLKTVGVLSDRLTAHERLPELLYWLDLAAEPGRHDAVREFYADIADNGEGAYHKALGAYYAAARLVRSANLPGVDRDEAERRRVQGLAYLDEIGEDVGDEKVWRYKVDDEDLYLFPLQSLALVKEELQFVIAQADKGSVFDRIAGLDLEGENRTLEPYRGKVVLIEFWATWCGSCRAELPKLRALDAELADAPFELVGLSIDKDLQTVRDYRAERPMDWTLLHIGGDSALWNDWTVRGTPTYVLLDEDGVVRARSRDLDGALRRQIDDLIKSSS